MRTSFFVLHDIRVIQRSLPIAWSWLYLCQWPMRTSCPWSSIVTNAQMPRQDLVLIIMVCQCNLYATVGTNNDTLLVVIIIIIIGIQQCYFCGWLGIFLVRRRCEFCFTFILVRLSFRELFLSFLSESPQFTFWLFSMLVSSFVLRLPQATRICAS